jgi:predicted dithiol-disulfide oxidoreductase (DUF899 family)
LQPPRSIVGPVSLVWPRRKSTIAEAINAERRAIPVLPLTNIYTFQIPDGPVMLKDLFGIKSELIVYYFMFKPTAEEGCQGCAFMTANFPPLTHLVISRAPIEKITPYNEKNS